MAPRYPAVGKRGVFTEDEALDRWPLARDVYEALNETGPCTPRVLARRLGVPPKRLVAVENALWWLTFDEDNGCRQFVCGHLMWGGGSQDRLVHRLPNDPADLDALERIEELANARAVAWRSRLNHLMEETE